MKKFYEITEQQLELIRAKLPVGIAFGFESYGSFFFSGDTVKNINSSHGSLLDLTLSSLFGKSEVDFLAETESGSYAEYILQKEKNARGLDSYEKIIGYVSSTKGLGNSLDSEIIPTYKEIIIVRMMLKDGMFETALRYWHTNIKPLSGISQDVSNFVEPILDKNCLDYGTAEAVIQAIKSAPVGSI